jgi:translocation and assembly module TamB
LKFFNKRRLLQILAIMALVILIVAGGLFVFLNSPAFEQQARRLIIREIENRTGAKATLGDFDWSFWNQHFRLTDLTIRGLEPPGAAPLAHFPQIDIGVNLRTLFQRKINLYQLGILQPEFHVLVNPDGTTNLPTPPRREPRRDFRFEISIDNFRISEGKAFLNERRIDVDFGVQNLAGALNYLSTTGVLASRITYEGLLERENRRTIPYTLSAQMDYVRGTLLTHDVRVDSGETALNLQGRINDLLTRTSMAAWSTRARWMFPS